MLYPGSVVPLAMFSFNILSNTPQNTPNAQIEKEILVFEIEIFVLSNFSCPHVKMANFPFQPPKDEKSSKKL